MIHTGLEICAHVESGTLMLITTPERSEIYSLTVVKKHRGLITYCS